MADNARMPRTRSGHPTLRRGPLALCTIACLLGSGTSFATSSDALAEVVISATRRAQPLLEVSASLSRIGPDELGLVDLVHAADALNRAPGTYVQRGSGQESLTAIRSPVLSGAGACGAFLVMEDSFPIRPIGFCNVNELFEINTSQAASIEVLRGPGTTVMGANAVHGAINVLTPSAAEVRNGAAVTAGSADFLSGRFSLSTADERPFAVYGLWRRDGGFRDHSATRDVKVNLLHDQKIGDGELRVRAATTRLDQQTAGFLRGFESYRDLTLRRSNANPEAFRLADAARLSLAWRRAPDEFSADELRLVLRDSSMSFLQHFLLGKPLERNRQRSLAVAAMHEDRLVAGLGYRIGIDLESSRGSLLETQDGPTLEGSAAARAIRPAGKHYDYTVAARSMGAYAQVGSKFGRGFDWRAAVRVDRTRYAYDNRMRDGNTAEDGSSCGPAGCLYSRPADRTDTFQTSTPRFELGWQANDTDRLYATISDGFRPPEATELYRLQRTQSVADLRAERMRAVELGWHHRSAVWRGSIALFDATRRDLILRDANGFNVVGGKTTHRGVEYALQRPLTEAWNLSLSGTRARHRYAFSRSIDGGETIRAGNDVDTAPRALHRLELSWSPSGRWSAGLAVQHVGDYFADAANEHRQPGHTVADLRLGLRLEAGWRIGLQIDDITDRLYADRADFAQGEWRYFPAPRRSVFLHVEWRDPR